MLLTITGYCSVVWLDNNAKKTIWMAKWSSRVCEHAHSKKKITAICLKKLVHPWIRCCCIVRTRYWNPDPYCTMTLLSNIHTTCTPYMIDLGISDWQCGRMGNAGDHKDFGMLGDLGSRHGRYQVTIWIQLCLRCEFEQIRIGREIRFEILFYICTIMVNNNQQLLVTVLYTIGYIWLQMNTIGYIWLLTISNESICNA